MKTLLPIGLLLSLSLNILAQNWSGVVTNRVSYYDPIKSNLADQTGFISVDSTAIVGANTEYYFCNTFRQQGGGCGTIDGASWMGSKFVHTPTGDEIYFNRLNDSILVKTQATLNDTWILTTNTNGHTYQATVIEVDTVTINSIVDSVKTIQLQAYNGVTPIASIYNVNFKLSKHNGFVELIPWYAFPYPVTTGYPSIFPFTTTAKYLDSNSLFYKNYGESVAKYQPGNEWITLCDSTIDFSYYSPDSSKGYTHDSIISSVLLPSGTIAFVSVRTEIYQVGSIQLNSNQSIINDTINSLQPNPLFNQTIIQVCPNYFNPDSVNNWVSFVAPRNMWLTFDQDSIGRNMLTYNDNDLAYLSNGISVGNPCYGFIHNLGPVFNTTKKWVEGIGLVHESVTMNSDAPLSVQECSIVYSNINGQVYGSKLNFAVSASQFEAKVTRLNASQLNISWNTMNESNVALFEIERSYDAVHFIKIGRQNTKGGNFATNNYSYIDDSYAKELNGFVYYRIKMIDIDGKVFYSNVAKYELSRDNALVVNGSIFSNQIELSNLELNATYQIMLSDAMGRKLYQTKIEDNHLSTFQIVGMNHLPQGVYFLNVVNVDEGARENFKLLKSN